VIYVSIALFLYISDFIYIYVSLLTVCLSVSLSKGICPFAPGHIVQTKDTCEMLMVVALHEIKYGLMYWERSDCMKRQDEQGYFDVSMHLSVLLSI
jgi:hypothetical protein